MKVEVMRFSRELHRNGVLPRDINSSFISLIAKCDNLELLVDFRPISLVGWLYKIIAKIPAIGLKEYWME